MYYRRLCDEGVWLINFWVVYLRTPNSWRTKTKRFCMRSTSNYNLSRDFISLWNYWGISCRTWYPIAFQYVWNESVKARFSEQLQLSRNIPMARMNVCTRLDETDWMAIYGKTERHLSNGWKAKCIVSACISAGNWIFDSTPWNLLQNHPIHRYLNSGT